MHFKNRFVPDMPSDLLCMAALFNFNAALYNIFVKPAYLLAVGWLVSSILFFLRSRQLFPIRNRLTRGIFWLIGIGILVVLWLS